MKLYKFMDNNYKDKIFKYAFANIESMRYNYEDFIYRKVFILKRLVMSSPKNYLKSEEELLHTLKDKVWYTKNDIKFLSFYSCVTISLDDMITNEDV